MTEKIKVWLDDERPTPEGWVSAKKASEAISLLRTGQVSEISLDNDLGPPEAGEGYDVICWIENEAFVNQEHFTPATMPVIHIHTANPVARKKMEATVEAMERNIRRFYDDC